MYGDGGGAPVVMGLDRRLCPSASPGLPPPTRGGGPRAPWLERGYPGSWPGGAPGGAPVSSRPCPSMPPRRSRPSVQRVEAQGSYPQGAGA